jgi:hypothetical protein
MTSFPPKRERRAVQRVQQICRFQKLSYKGSIEDFWDLLVVLDAPDSAAAVPALPANLPVSQNSPIRAL